MKMRCLAWLLPLLFCCCHKPKDNSNNNNGSGFTYSTAYDSVISTYANKTIDFSFTLKVLTGSISTNPIKYAISSLPTNVVVSPASLTVSGLLGGLFTFTVGDVPVGNYPLTFTSTSGTVTLTHKLTLAVIANPDYSTSLAGNYPGCYDYCQPSDSLIHYTSVVTAYPDTPYLIRISNIKNLGAGVSVKATLSNIVTIPLQTIGGYKIWGTGYYTHDNAPNNALYMMIINDTMVGLDTQTCTMHIQH